MKKICLIVSLTLIALINANSQGRRPSGGAAPGVSHIPNGVTPGDNHSNAPAGTPAASTDRDKGQDRAADVGQGKDKGHKKNPKRNPKK
jgi:hypothetical protein